VAATAKRRALLAQGLKRDLVRQTAYYMLAARALEGLAAWVLYNESVEPSYSTAWPIHLCFLSYFIVNAALCLRYRAADTRPAIIVIDLANNLGTMALAAGLTGGMLSPVVLICLIKIAGYLLVFSTQTGIIAISTTLAGFGTLALGEQLDWWSVTALGPEIERQIDFVFRVTVLGTILVSAPWLLRLVANKEKQLSAEAARARTAAAREHAAHNVARALLAVSEVVSRLTQLDDILNKLVELLPRVLAVDYCGIFLWSEEHATYRGAAVSGVESSMARQLTSIRLGPKDVPDFEWVRQLGHSAVVSPRGIARLGVPEAPALLMAPLISGGHFYGVLHFGRRGGQNSFTQNDITIADGVASQAAVALERARLVEESRRLVRAVESTGEAVLMTDRHHRIVFVNQAVVDMFGYARDELLGRDSRTLGGTMSDEWLRELQRAVNDHSWRGEATARRKDGSTFPITLHASLVRSEDNRVQGAVAIIENISAQKQLHEQMQRADRLAAAGEIASGVAHEVNNALVGILGQTELARGASDMDTLRGALANVETQGRRISEVVQELLGFARRQPPQRGPVDLRGLVRDTLTLMAHDLSRNHIHSETRFAEGLPPVSVDAKQIQQVLVNLFTNAMQAMHPNGGTLSVTVRSDDGMVSVDVQDTGTGISPEALPRVFDPFFSTKAKGTGLGLSVSYGIVQAHGGDLTVQSTLHEGTTFTLKLPAALDAPAHEPRTVLLVDDDPAVAETLRAMLTREGLHVRRAETGKEALLILARDTFDAVFLDVRLPDLPGTQVYERLAAIRPEQARRVVFVTGGLWRHDSRGLRETLPRGQPTLSKPCTAAQIREVLRLLRDTRAAA
jgi:PAS domain S-box-containing protein